MKRWETAFLILIVIALLCVGYGTILIRHGFSARERPSSLEEAVSHLARNMAIPSGAKHKQNPFSATPENLKEARRHFADHCAICHANDGSGQTEIGRNLYPKPPDMRLSRTQNLADGEIFYIIRNGVRLTGMPSWADSHRDDEDWKLVLFIRHLPALTPEEKKDMEQFNPHSPMEHMEHQQQEQGFPGGDKPSHESIKDHHTQ